LLDLWGRLVIAASSSCWPKSASTTWRTILPRC